MKTYPPVLVLAARISAILVIGAPLSAQVVFAQAPAATAAPAPPGSAPPPPNDQTSYLFGVTFGSQLHSVGIHNEVSVDAMARGLKDGLNGKALTPADQQQLQSFVRTVSTAAVARNQAAAAEFLARNGKDKGVVTTASGLEYKIIAPGDKKAPAVKPSDQVTVQYRGKLLDGTEFDSSYSRGMPATFPVNGVIKGWQEALVLMKPGAKWQLFVPPALAYGAMPKAGIPGGSLLIFDVELQSVMPEPAAAPAAPPGTPPPQ